MRKNVYGFCIPARDSSDKPFERKFSGNQVCARKPSPQLS